MSGGLHYRSIGLLTLGVMLSPTLSFAYRNEIRQAATELAERITAKGKKTLAVVDFTNLDNRVTPLGQFLAEQLSVAIASGAADLEVVERGRLRVLLEEHKLATTGIIDPQTASKLGQIAGVQVLVTGTITPSAESVNLTAKALDTTSARILGSAVIDIPKTKQISDLLGEDVVPRATDRSSPSAAQPRSSSGEPSRTQVPADATPSYELRVTESAGVRFGCEACLRTGGAVACTVQVTSIGEDRTMNWLKATLYDNGANSHPASTIQLANQTVRASSDGSGDLKTLMPSNVEMKLVLRFEGVSSEATGVSLLLIQGEVWVGTPDGLFSSAGAFTAQLRNLPLVP